VDVTIRAIGGEEWPLWRELRLRALADSPDAFRSTLEEESSQPDEWWAEIIGTTAEHPRGGLWVATVHGEPAGILFGRIDPAYTTLHVGAMWVAPEFRSHGVGPRLVEAAVDWAKGSGVSLAELWVTEGNARAAAFYQRHGFRPADDTQALRLGSDLTVRKLTTSI
jgi:GNAT superfamily N-acetyltransferase